MRSHSTNACLRAHLTCKAGARVCSCSAGPIRLQKKKSATMWEKNKKMCQERCLGILYTYFVCFVVEYIYIYERVVTISKGSLRALADRRRGGLGSALRHALVQWLQQLQQNCNRWFRSRSKACVRSVAAHALVQQQRLLGMPRTPPLLDGHHTGLVRASTCVSSVAGVIG